MSRKILKFDVFGRYILVENTGHRWRAYYVGSDGKRRPAEDIIIPSALEENRVERYLADLCHEWATGKNPDVRRLH